MKEIILEKVKTGKTESFRFDHALNLLRYEQARGFNEWKLPDTSNYIFENGNINERPGNQVGKDSEKPARNFKGKAKEDQAQAPHGGGD
jgi:hypothetical protein